MGHVKPGAVVGQLNIAKTNKFDKITLFLLKRLSFSYNIHTKLIYRGLYLPQLAWTSRSLNLAP